MSFDSIWHRLGRDILFADKPFGLNTHASDLGRMGFAEMLEASLEKKIFVAHRLDKTTSGAMVFTLSAARAEELRVEFSSRQVKKTYLFVTDRKSQNDQHQVQSDDGAETLLERVKRSPFYELWSAKPVSGKTHQIRKHAAQVGLAILGDNTYGGSPFPVLCLHAQRLELPGEDPFETPPPRYFERLGLLRDSLLVTWLAEIDRRQRLFHFLERRKDIVRLVDHQDLVLDDLGETLIASWYGKPLNEAGINRLHFLSNLLGKPLLIQPRLNRGEDPNSNPQIEVREAPEEWTGSENGLTYRLARNRGLSFGIFVDQRKNRDWVQKHSRGLRVLNLFAYTGGFSVAAAHGGAEKVVTVDISNKYLNWAKENFTLNGLALEPHLFISADAMDFVKRAKKRGEVYDLIICDPPSFARHDGSTFKLEKALDELMAGCLKVLAPKGHLLFSCNLESLNAQALIKKAKSLSPMAEVQTAPVAWDCQWEDHPSSMKAILVRTTHPRLPAAP